MKTIKQLNKSLHHAFNGVRQVYKTENSFRLQILAGLLVVILAFYLPLQAWEQVIVIIMIGFVLVLELINSVFERLVDSFRSRVHPMVGEIKDIMAATVLLASVFTVIIGLIIFIPYLVDFI
ncbi:MAG: diacylglycerol kinase family protein [Candidatus Uhrbacteria bacterium]